MGVFLLMSPEMTNTQLDLCNCEGNTFFELYKQVLTAVVLNDGVLGPLYVKKQQEKHRAQGDASYFEEKSKISEIKVVNL